MRCPHSQALYVAREMFSEKAICSCVTPLRCRANLLLGSEQSMLVIKPLLTKYLGFGQINKRFSPSFSRNFV